MQIILILKRCCAYTTGLWASWSIFDRW